MHKASCLTCPIQLTEYCHLVNPNAKKYTRTEKLEIRKMLDQQKSGELVAPDGRMSPSL